MYRNEIIIDNNSYIELASRITDTGEQLLFTIRGQRTDKQPVITCVLVNKEEATSLAAMIKTWIDMEKTSL